MNEYSNTAAAYALRNKAKIIFVLKLVIAASLLIYIFTFIRLKEIIDSLKNANYIFLSFSVLLLFPNIFLQYKKWEFTCEHLFGETSKRKILLSLFYGFPAAVFTPARAGEYFGRGLAFKNRPFSEIILATMADKFFTILATFIIGSFGMVIFVYKFYATNVFIPVPLITVLIFLTSITILFLVSDKKWFDNLLKFLSNHKHLKKISERLEMFKKLDKNFAYKMTLYSGLFFFCYLVQFVFLIIAFSHHAHLGDFLLASILIMFSKSILSPLSLSELGIREGASIFFLTQFGEPAIVALNASLSLFAINILLPSIIGLFLLAVKTND